MIIWSRWGILVLVPIFLGVSTGALLNLLLDHGADTGPNSNVFVGVGLVAAGVYTYLFDRYVLTAHLDKPDPRVTMHPLLEPVVHPNGYRQTHYQVPVLDEHGRPVVVRQRNTLFFVPVHVWPFILGGIGLVVTIVSTIRVAMG